MDAGAAASCGGGYRRAHRAARRAPVAPGGEGHVQLVLERPIAAAAGDRFVLRDTTAQRTIGGGSLLDLRAPARKRRTPERLAQLARMRIADPDAALAAMLDRAAVVRRSRGVRARPRAWRRPKSRRSVERHGDRIAGHGSRSRRRPGCGSSARSLATLEAFHSDNPDLPGIGLERLRLQLEPRLPAPAFAAMLQGLRAPARSRWMAHGCGCRATQVRPTPRKRSSGARSAAARRRRAFPSAARARHRKCAWRTEADVRRLLKCSAVWARSTRSRTTISSFAAPSPRWSRCRRRCRAAPNGQFTAAQFRDRLDNGRKVAIQILEFFDRHGVTLRRGDMRRINKHRLDLFRRAGDEDRKQVQEENRPRWGVRTSNPGGAASRSLVGSTPLSSASYPAPAGTSGK